MRESVPDEECVAERETVWEFVAVIIADCDAVPVPLLDFEIEFEKSRVKLGDVDDDEVGEAAEREMDTEPVAPTERDAVTDSDVVLSEDSEGLSVRVAVGELVPGDRLFEVDSSKLAETVPLNVSVEVTDTDGVGLGVTEGLRELVCDITDDIEPDTEICSVKEAVGDQDARDGVADSVFEMVSLDVADDEELREGSVDGEKE
jgi:hypothetical protein